MSVDKYLICKECGIEFCWRAVDFDFMQSCVENKTPHPISGIIMEKVVAPVRCQGCRNKRKAFFNAQKK